MIILGIDPGTLVTGYGVVERKGSLLRMIDCGMARNHRDDDMPQRLKTIYDTLCRAIDRWHPDAAAIETAFYGKNIQSSLKIGQARGVAMLAAVNAGLPVSEYAPREIKRAITGSGAASKEQVQFMIITMLRMKTAPEALDISDALAVAVTHAHRITTPTAGTSSWKSFIAAHPERVVSQ
jgi:crossover junction endodeoxyribonuclease RuvC